MNVTIEHVITITDVDRHGYPYRATCACGWVSRSYAALFAAKQMGDDHIDKA